MTEQTPEQRIADLEHQLEEKERRLAEVNADLDKANNLVRRMREHPAFGSTPE
jgi:uncharacterized coiled-coil protein SlyX